MELQLPRGDPDRDDAARGGAVGGGDAEGQAARELLADVVRSRLASSAGKEITPEEGMLLQMTLHQCSPGFALVPLEEGVISEGDLKVRVRARAGARVKD